MKKHIQRFKDNKKSVLIFLAIMIVGIFLRTYQHADLMRFGKDQARDASLMRDYVSGAQPLPLLGPNMGKLEFVLGPAFYYLQYISAKMFGFSPETIAFPDLLFSIMTIPMLFFFLKKYFSKNISLALTAVYSVSFYAVQNGRFAWNPNSLMLFSMLFLYSFLELANQKQKKKIFWAIMVGVALGIGVQLHTLFIFIGCATFFIATLYLIKKKKLVWKNIFVVLTIAFLLNIPQVISEWNTRGVNTKAFFSGVGQESFASNPFPLNMFVSTAWQLQGNTMFVFPAGDDTTLHIFNLVDSFEHNYSKGTKGILSNAPDLMRILAGISLSIMGYVLLFRSVKKEEDIEKKMYLQLIGVWVITGFLFMIPLSHVLELRYLLILQFVPFVLLGLLVEFLQEKFKKNAFYWTLSFLVILYVWNIYSVFVEFNSFTAGDGDIGISIWGEEKFAGDFILEHKNLNQKVHMLFEPANADKFIRPLSYFDSSIDAPLLHSDGTPLNDPNTAYFTLILNDKKEKNVFERAVAKSAIYNITASASRGRFIIYKLELKNQ